MRVRPRTIDAAAARPPARARFERLLAAVPERGARIAEPGELTRRAVARITDAAAAWPPPAGIRVTDGAAA